MAVIKVTSSTNKSIKSLVNYLTKKEKTEEKLVSAKDCDENNIVRDFIITKQLYKKKEGRQYKHYIQSFKPGEITPGRAHELGKQLAQQFKGYEVFIVTHQDKKHIHNHLVVNSVSFENGKKLHTSKRDLIQLKEQSDRICEREGLSVIKNTNKKGLYLSQAQIKLAERQQNNQLKLINSIRYAKKKSTSKEEYIKTMQQLGYQVEWGTRKRINYIDLELKEKNENLKAKGKKGIKFKFGERALSKYIDKKELTKEEIINECRRNAEKQQQSQNRRDRRNREQTIERIKRTKQYDKDRNGEFIAETSIGTITREFQQLSRETQEVDNCIEKTVRQDRGKSRRNEEQRRNIKRTYEKRDREFER